jgi:hypothetical protein
MEIENRTDQLKSLRDACHRVLLEPQNAQSRAILGRAVAATQLAPLEGDTLLTASLVKEARAHAEKLAFRLETPGYPALYINAITARLCQTLAVLELQLRCASPVAQPPASVTR